jgi:hypothetical protein
LFEPDIIQTIPLRYLSVIVCFALPLFHPNTYILFLIIKLMEKKDERIYVNYPWME